MKRHFEMIYSGFRADESSPAVVALNGWRYLLKYLFKKREYPFSDREWAAKSADIAGRPDFVQNSKNLLSEG